MPVTYADLRYVAISMIDDSHGDSSPHRWRGYTKFAEACAAADGVQLADHDGVYGRVYDRLEDCFVDDMADDHPELNRDLVEVRERLARDFPPLKVCE